MTEDRNADLETAMQYLVWALEHIEKVGNQQAATRTRRTIEALRRGTRGKNKEHGT
jgi:hypothetical protein